MKFIMSAREKGQDSTEYVTLDKHGLRAEIEIMKGEGSAKNPFLVKLGIHNGNKEKWSGVLHVQMEFKKRNPKFFLPAFMYGSNRGECPQNVPNEFPRLREEIQRPSSPEWMVRGDRLSHPVALVYDSDKIYGFSASPYFIGDEKKKQWKPNLEGKFYQYAGYTCSLSKGTVGYTLGYENAPWLFVKSHDVRERAPLDDNNCFELEIGENVEFTMDVYEFSAIEELEINTVIKEVYYQYHQPPRKSSTIKTTVEDLANAVYKDGWLPKESCYAGQVFENLETSGYRYNPIISISWTNGLAVAVPMLIASLRLKDELMRVQAISCITNIITHSINPLTGLPYEACNNGKWSNKGWWFDGMHTAGHSSYLIGQAMYYILRAYEYEKFLNHCSHDDWIEFVKEVLFKIEKTKNMDHEYPFILSEKTGSGIEYDALSGAWCMAAMAYYCHLSGDQSQIPELLKSEKHYYQSFVKNMECYGGPLDTDKATDSEGIIAYIKALKYIHILTKEQCYLEHMKDGLSYEFSFKFCYNSPIQVPPLSRIGWSSCGGSVTSIANPHIHPMSSNLVDELLYLADYTKDEYVIDRMKDTIGWGCQTYNTHNGEYDYGKKGWMSERFCHCEGLLSQKYRDGSLASTWFCLMPWASASIIDGLAGDYWTRIKA